MGLYNTIIVDCPDKSCDYQYEFQTKSGCPVLKRYHISEVPALEVLGIIEGERTCPKCGTKMTIQGKIAMERDFSYLVKKEE